MKPSGRRAARASRAAAAASGAGKGRDRKGSADSDEESSAPAYDLVQIYMTYTNDHQLKHKNKATKILGQAKTLVQEYEDKINAVIVKEGEALEACYDKHRKECAADLKERDALLKELAVNWEWIENLRKILAERTEKFEQQRYAGAEKVLGRAEKQMEAAHAQMRQSIRTTTTVDETDMEHVS